MYAVKYQVHYLMNGVSAVAVLLRVKRIFEAVLLWYVRKIIINCILQCTGKNRPPTTLE